MFSTETRAYPNSEQEGWGSEYLSPYGNQVPGHRDLGTQGSTPLMDDNSDLFNVSKVQLER